MATYCDQNEITVAFLRESILDTLAMYVDSRVCDVRPNRNGLPLSKTIPQLSTGFVSLMPTAKAIDAFVHIFCTRVSMLLAEAVLQETPLANTLSLGFSSRDMIACSSWVLQLAAFKAAGSASTTLGKTSGTPLSQEYVMNLIRLTDNGNISTLKCGIEPVLTRSSTEVGILRGKAEGRKNPGASGRTHWVMLPGVSSDLGFALKIASADDFILGKTVKWSTGDGSDTHTAIDDCISTPGAAAAQRGNRTEVKGFPRLHDTGWNEDAAEYAAVGTMPLPPTKTKLPLMMSSLLYPVKAEGLVIVPTTTTHTVYVMVMVAVVVGAIAIIVFIVVSRLKAAARAREMKRIYRCVEAVPSKTGRRREDEKDILPSLNS